MFAFLGLWRYALYAALIAGAIAYVAHKKSEYNHNQQAIGAAPYIAAIENQKREAAALLASETAKNAAASQAWTDYAKGLTNDHAKDVADLNKRLANRVRLTDPGRRPSGSCPAGEKGSTGIPEKAPGLGAELSGIATDFLYAEAGRADAIRIWAKGCAAYINKDIP